MPLNAANMVTNGHLTHDDVLQFVNLLTGVMTDQPVTISNTLRVTGVTTLASDAIVAGTIKYGTTGASTTTIYSPSAGQIAVTAALTLGGGLFFNPDNSNDIGATGTGRPRNIFVAGALTAASATLSGTLNFSGNARRITGDMTSTPTVNRLWFQTSVANGSTALGILPNGTSTISAINMSSSSSDPDNAALGQIICTPSFFQFTSGHQGTGVAGALSLAVDGVEAMHVRTDLHVGFNDPGDPAIHFRLKTANKLSTAYGFQHVDPTPANIFYTRNDGYVFIQGPLAMGNGVGTGSTTGILMGNGAYISTYTNASDVRVLMNALTVTPGLTSTNTFQANGPSTLNGNASVIGTLTVSSTLNMQNATVQNCTTYYGVNNGCYLTNDGANWNIAGNFAFYGSITSLSNLNLSGTITYPVNIVMSGTGCITTNTGYLYLRSATGNVYMDSGPLIVTNGYVNVAQYVQSPLYYVGSTTMYIQQANSTALRYLVPQGGVHSFEYPSGYGTLYAAAFTVASARKFKDNIVVLVDPLGIVLDDRVHGVTYTDKCSGEEKVGFVADDWLGVLPSVIGLNDEGDVETFDYDRVGAVTFEALKQYVKESRARLDALERKLAA